MKITIHYLFILSLESFGFFAWILLLVAFCLHPIPSIWLGNSKLNSGQLSKFIKHKLSSQLNNGLTLRNPNPKSPQKRFPFGRTFTKPSLFLGPNSFKKILFPSNFVYKVYLKRIKERAAKTFLWALIHFP